MTNSEERLILASGLFDPEWYSAHYPDVPSSGLSPAAHYLRSGAREARNPGPRFHSGFYLSRYPDAAGIEINPLVHYLRVGLPARAAIRSVERHADCELIRLSGFFDPAWYLSVYPEVAASGCDPLEHFLDFALPELRDPGPLFSTPYYLLANPGLFAANLSNPLLHFLQLGLKENRNSRGVDWQREREAVLQSGYFEPTWYLSNNPDVAQSGVDPLDHYLEFGGKEGRAAGPRFESAFYLARHPDVANLGVNPLLHYIRFGAGERRDIRTDANNSTGSFSD